MRQLQRVDGCVAAAAAHPHLAPEARGMATVGRKKSVTDAMCYCSRLHIYTQEAIVPPIVIVPRHWLILAASVVLSTKVP